MAAKKRRSSSKSLTTQSIARGTRPAIHALAAPRNTLDAHALIAHLNTASLPETLDRSLPFDIPELISDAPVSLESIGSPISSVARDLTSPLKSIVLPDTAEQIAAPLPTNLTGSAEEPATDVATKTVNPEVKQLRRRRLYVRGRIPGLKQEMQGLLNERNTIKGDPSASEQPRLNATSTNRRQQYIASRIESLRQERKALTAERRDLATRFKGAVAASHGA